MNALQRRSLELHSHIIPIYKVDKLEERPLSESSVVCLYS